MLQLNEEQKLLKMVNNSSSNNNSNNNGKCHSNQKHGHRRLSYDFRQLLLYKEPEEKEEIDPNVAYRNSVFETIKNGFSLTYGEDGELKINVDNIYPLLKMLELNPQNDNVLDMVRTACIETFGDIEPKDFDSVVVSFIQEKDEVLWKDRLEKKKELAEKRREKAKQDAGLPKAPEPEPTNNSEDEEDGDGEEKEKKEKKLTPEEKRVQKLQEELEQETKEDELFDTIKMAFKFIDTDRDGIISIKDIYNLMFGLGEVLTDDELQDMFRTVDLNQDGRITYEVFKHFLSGEPPPAEDQADVTESADGTPVPEAEQKDACSAEQPVAPEASQSPVPQTPEPLSAEQEERRTQRKKSLLWGYMTSAANKFAEGANKKAEKDDVKEVPEAVETIEETGSVTGDVFEAENTGKSEQPGSEEEKVPSSQDTETEATSQLGAIKEEGEHSEFDHNQTIRTAPDKKMDNKRRMFSRQSSSASLKNRQGSTAAASEGTVADSGFGTFDDSDIRGRNDMQDDFTDDETLGESVELEKLSVHVSTLRRSSRSSRDEIVDDNDGTSPVSSRAASHLTRENLSAVENDTLFEKTNKVRTMQFVSEHMYHEIEQELKESEIEEERKIQERLQRAQFLQKAIFRRTNTSPTLKKVTVSKTEVQPKTNVNGMVCSHINIDLTGNVPPKANIQALRQYTERAKSARTPREMTSARSMSIVTIDTDIGTSRDLSKWPMRSLTRPKSSVNRRILANVESPTTPRVFTPSLTLEKESPRRMLKRPQTAPMNYQINRDRSPVIIPEPLANSDALYPGKSSLTTCHHGFRSIWPIGRHINVLQKKRPFSAFEMNSYSRAIEREELNFRNSRSPSTCYTGDVMPSRKIGQRLDFPQPQISSKVIKLELETKQLSARSNNKRASMLSTPIYYPATAR